MVKRLVNKVCAACISAGILATGAQASEIREWNFQVYLNEREIGHHKVQVQQNSGETRVEVEAKFAVKFLFVTAYRYLHTASEIWQGDCLSSISTDTNDNGDVLSIRSSFSDDSLQIRTKNEQSYLQGCVRSFAYWNPEWLATEKLLNTQNGEYETVLVTDKGMQSLEFKGQQVNARKLELQAGDKALDLWYTEQNDWIALQTRVAGGRLLSYYREPTESGEVSG